MLPVSILRFLPFEATQFLDVSKAGHITHPHWIENAVQMVTLMLNHPGMETLRLTINRCTIGPGATIPDARMARHRPGKARHGQASFQPIGHVVR